MADSPVQRRASCFTTAMRLRRRCEFQDAFHSGVRASDGRLTVWAQRNDLPHPRLGIVVGRKYGGAVQRNRIKRLLREAFRLNRVRLPVGLDLVCAPRVGVRCSLDELAQSLVCLARRLEAQFARRNARR